MVHSNYEETAVLSSATETDLKVYGNAVRETIEIVLEGFEVQSDHLAGTVYANRHYLRSGGIFI